MSNDLELANALRWLQNELDTGHSLSGRRGPFSETLSAAADRIAQLTAAADEPSDDELRAWMNERGASPTAHSTVTWLQKWGWRIVPARAGRLSTTPHPVANE